MVGKGKRLEMSSLIAPKGVQAPTSMVPQRGLVPPVEAESQERQFALTVKVPASLYAKLRRYALEKGRTHQDVGLAALRAYLDENIT